MQAVMLHGAERQRKLGEEFSVSLMKRIGDNPPEERLGAETAEGHGLICSLLTCRASEMRYVCGSSTNTHRRLCHEDENRCDGDKTKVLRSRSEHGAWSEEQPALLLTP